MSGDVEGLLSDDPEQVKQSLNNYLNDALNSYIDDLGGSFGVETGYKMFVGSLENERLDYSVYFEESEASIGFEVYIRDGYRQEDPVRTLEFILDEGSGVKFQNVMNVLENELPVGDESGRDGEYFFSFDRS